MTDTKTGTPSVAQIIAFSRELDSVELTRATAWAGPYDRDVFRALSECPRVTWLAALARALGADLAVDRWKTALENTPEHVEYMTRMAQLADSTAMPPDEMANQRSLLEERLRRMPQPTGDEYQGAIEKLRDVLDLEALAMRAASLPLHESDEEREERVLAAAIEDSNALVREDLDDMTFASLWGRVGGRTFRRVSRAGAERLIRETQALLLKRKWQSSS